MPPEDEEEEEEEEGREEGPVGEKPGRGRPPKHNNSNNNNNNNNNKKKNMKKKEGEGGREEGRVFLQKMHALFRSLFANQLATAELQEGVSEVMWRWVRGVEKEERRRRKRKEGGKEGWKAKQKQKGRGREGGRDFLLREVVPVEVGGLCVEERTYEGFWNKIPACLVEGNEGRRREGVREGVCRGVYVYTDVSIYIYVEGCRF